jgi:VPDSG-CTERM motif
MKISIGRIRPIAVIATSFFGIFGTTSAATITWEDIHSGNPLDFLEEKWGANDSSYDLSYSNTWNIATKGFIPGDSITGIIVSFAFADDGPGTIVNDEDTENAGGGDVVEKVDITAGNTLLWDHFDVDGKHPESTYKYYSLTLNPLTHSSIFSDLAADGKLAYSVTIQQILDDSGSESINREDTCLKVAKIQATYTPSTRSENGNPVPDGGTSVALLGLGLMGLAGMRGKQSRANKANY